MNQNQSNDSAEDHRIATLWDMFQWIHTMGSLLIKLIQRKWTKEEYKMFIFAMDDTKDIVHDNMDIFVMQDKKHKKAKKN